MIICYLMPMKNGSFLQISRLLALALAMSLALAAGGCRERSHDPESAPVLLQINGRAVTLESFTRQFEQTLPPNHTLGQDEKDELKRAFLRQLIDRELALSEARRRGLSVSTEELDEALADYRRDYPEGEFESLLRAQGTSLQQWRSDLEERLLIDKALAQAVYARVEVSAEEIETYYQQHLDKFDRPQQVRARQIVLDNEEQGENILEQLHTGADFAEMAELFSLSPEGESGGDLGFFPEGEMPSEFDEVVFSLPAGTLSELVRSDYGFHIFLVEDKRPARHLSLEEATPEIVDSLRRAKEEQAYQEWLMELGANAYIDVNWQLL
ncbi:foldase protein PrsA [Geoalkalibacter ferrihydriticus]|uniref:PpiC domain-containing protein n=2 Tax=Geoalkalibacter ferrihydriticus TaxID=392333 RepID=A0A0C2HL75_9BACT|nr:peptidyl-prolyl cis-trans isomerase [Geoalkalibacter ferrihydriticus]KIH77826.1 hypothetical protein GFER_04095 [Geoalkalibacter ferrihydriticus DSM 17813]SDL81114.1 foldase protein PrsA [Geoalkalibacter ferrihydriticus]